MAALVAQDVGSGYNRKVPNDAQNAALTSGIISGASYPVALGVGGVGRTFTNELHWGKAHYRDMEIQ